MPRSIERTGDIPPATPLGRPLRIEVVARGNLHLLPSWRRALAHERKDHRYYERWRTRSTPSSTTAIW